MQIWELNKLKLYMRLVLACDVLRLRSKGQLKSFLIQSKERLIFKSFLNEAELHFTTKNTLSNLESFFGSIYDFPDVDVVLTDIFLCFETQWCDQVGDLIDLGLIHQARRLVIVYVYSSYVFPTRLLKGTRRDFQLK